MWRPADAARADQTQRVTCPNCQALLDCNAGKLEYLQTLRKDDAAPMIPLGTVGQWQGTEYTVIGFLKRSTTEEGTEYAWFEYLLYNPQAGFRWLVQSDRHWSFVEPVPPGDVSAAQYRRYQGVKYKLFQRGLATVRYVLGEFYWKVSVGEEVFTADFIAPPRMLSLERTPEKATAAAGDAPHAEEIEFSLGTYATREQIQAAFGVSDLPRSWSVAPHQPNPLDWRVFAAWFGFIALLWVADFAMTALFHKLGDGFFFGLALVLVSLPPVGSLLHSLSFESSRWKSSNLESE